MLFFKPSSYRIRPTNHITEVWSQGKHEFDTENTGTKVFRQHGDP